MLTTKEVWVVRCRVDYYPSKADQHIANRSPFKEWAFHNASLAAKHFKRIKRYLKRERQTEKFWNERSFSYVNGHAKIGRLLTNKLEYRIDADPSLIQRITLEQNMVLK